MSPARRLALLAPFRPHLAAVATWIISSALTRAAVLLTVIVLAYAPSLGGIFLFDDIPAILQNESIRDLSQWSLILAGADNPTTTGRPLLNLSLAINYAWSQDRPWSYHLVNLLAHAGVAVLLGEIVRRTLTMPRLQFHAAAADRIGLAVASLWAVHPLTTSAVTYIVQRAEVFVGGFYLLTLWAVLQDERTRTASGSMPDVNGIDKPHASRFWPWLALLANWCGMATKEVMATAPILIPLYDRIYLSASWRELWRKRGSLYIGLFSGWLLLAGLMYSSSGRKGTAGIGYGVNSLDYARTQFAVICEYLRLSIWPVGLAVDWGFLTVVQFQDWAPQAFLILILLATAFWLLRYHSAWGYPAIWFFALLAPTSTIIPLVTQTAAEHRMYLPLMGLCVLFVCSLTGLIRCLTSRTRSSWISSGLITLLVFMLAMLSSQRNSDYTSWERIWTVNLRHRPKNPRISAYVAGTYLQQGRAREAYELVDRAIELDPTGKTAGDYTQPNIHILSALYGYRGQAAFELGRPADALPDLERSISIFPLQPFEFLKARVLLVQQEYTATIHECDRIEIRYPDEPLLYSLRGLAYLGLGDRRSAEREARIALNRGFDLDPLFVERLRKGPSAEAPTP